MKKVDIIYLSLCANVILLFFLFKKNNAIEVKPFSNPNIEFAAKQWLASLELQTMNESSLLNEDTKFLNETGSYVSIKNKVRNGAKLVLKLNTSSCELCVNSIIDLINKDKSFPSDKLIIVTSIFSKEDFLLKSRYKNHTFPLYGIKSGFDFTVDKNDEPYFFVIDSNYKAIKFFIPIREIPEQTQKYLNQIKNLLNG